MKKWIPWTIAIILVCVIGLFGYRVYTRRKAQKAAAANLRQNVAQAQVQKRDLEVVVSGKGSVQSNLKKNVQPGVAGKVTQVLVKEGDLVKAGTPMFVLYNDSLAYQASQARLDLALAQQALENLTGPAGGKAKADLDVKSAENSLATAQDKVDNLTVASPIGGEVWSLAVKAGDSVKAGQTTIATVGDTSAFTIEIKVKQADLIHFRTGVAVAVAPGGDLPLLTGVVTSIGKEGTAGSKGVEFPATVTVTKSDPNLRAGMNVNVNYTADDGSTFSTPGSVKAQDRKDVKAEVDGTVKSVAASEGSTVAKDQTLVTLENDSLLVALDQAKNTLEGARQTLASFQNTIDSQRLKVESAQVSYEDKAESAAKLVVKSPVDGKVLSCSIQVGDDVTANQSVASVGQVSPLTVVIPVDELDVVNVAPGQPAKIEIDALPGQKFDGVVQKIAQEGTVQQGITNYNVTVELRSDAPRLGMSATATVAVAQKSQVLSIPVEAIKWNQGQAYVNQMENGQVVQKRVKIGVQSDLYAEVASGLNEGETVLVGNTSTGTGIGPGMGGLRIPGQVPKTQIQQGTQTKGR